MYRVRFREGERELEVEGDKKYIDFMMKRFGFLDDSSKASSKKESNISVKEHTSPTKLSPAEFILQYQLKKHTDIVIAFGYYLEKNRGLDKFTPGDITNCYYEAKMEPSNTSQMIIQNIKRGFFMPSKQGKNNQKGSKFYTVTQSGIRYVEHGFKKIK